MLIPWRFVPTIIACLVAVILLYGAYYSLHATQTLHLGSGTPGGGYYELGEKLQQVLAADLREQRLEAPVAFERIESVGPPENVKLLADRRAQLGLLLDGLTVKPKTAGDADIRGLMKLSTSSLHIVVSRHVTARLKQPLRTFSDLVAISPSRLGRPLRVYVGSPEGSAYAVMTLVLNYFKVSTDKGLPWELIHGGTYADAAKELLHDRLDVLCILVPVGSPAITTVAHEGTLLPLPDGAIDAIHTLNPALLPSVIPAGVYNKDFPKTATTTLGAEEILAANGEVSNRLAFRIVRTLALHWPELQAGMLLPEDFNKGQLTRNTYFSLHPGAIAYYKGDTVPLWPWFEDKVRLAIDHRDIVLSVVGGIPTVYTVFYAWSQRRRVTQLMARIDAMRRQGEIDRATIENIRMHAITLVAQGKLSRESYDTLNEFIEAQASARGPDRARTDETPKAAA